MPKRDYNFIEMTLRHGCPRVNLLHIFRTLSPRNTSGRLLLIFISLRSSCVENGPFGTKAGWTIEAGGCLERFFRRKPSSVADVQRAINVPSFQRFEVVLRVALHDLVHCVIG